MKEMSKSEKEAYEYKNSSLLKLRLTIFGYKFLNFCSNEIVEFVISLTPYFIAYVIFVKINLLTLLVSILIHYFLIWGFLRKKLNLMLVNKDEQKEIRTIIPILEKFIEERKKV
jgi:hypothetical protein